MYHCCVLLCWCSYIVGSPERNSRLLLAMNINIRLRPPTHTRDNFFSSFNPFWMNVADLLISAMLSSYFHVSPFILLFWYFMFVQINFEWILTPVCVPPHTPVTICLFFDLFWMNGSEICPTRDNFSSFNPVWMHEYLYHDGYFCILYL